METAVKEPVDVELHLLTDWSDPDAGARHRKAAIAAILIHCGVIVALVMVPRIFPDSAPAREIDRIVTPLIEPLTRLTQKEPNRGKVMQEFETRAAEERPRIQAPVTAPPVPREQPRPAVIPSAPPPKPAAPLSLPEPPKVETAVKEPPKIELPQVAQAPPPPPPAAEKPKLQLENVGGPGRAPGPGERRIPLPSSSPLSDAIRDTVHGTGLGGRQAIGDPGAFDPGVFGGVNQPSAPGVQGAGIELLSDASGVDFRPYLSQVLAAVRRNWMAVWPESVRLGLRGRVTLQVAIGRDGMVSKLVYDEHSGSRPLDEAAVAGVSASNPFPPLPGEFRGDRVVLRLNFVYNMPRRR
jgi:TonB family protein